MLRTGGIDKQDISYFNGTEIGRTGEGASLTTYKLPREYPIPAGLNTSTNAVIAVRGYSCCYDGSFNGDWYLENCATGEKIDLSGSWKIKVELNLGKVSLRRSTDLFGLNNPNTPGILFDSMIRPLIPCAIAGTIWYQGESNAGSIKDSKEYYEILKYLINDWRYQFRNHDMPFLMVQLAGYGQQESYSAKTTWPYLRESQRTLCGDLPNTYMATAIDCGDATDIHPQDKQTVGYRLAMNALHNNYHFTGIVPGGPELLRARQEAPGTVRLDFAWSAGMHLDCEAEQSFYVSADGENFIPATHAEVDGNSVVVTQAELNEIRCVRYAWADYPVNTLYNGDGFPASPFNAEIK